MTAKRTTMVLTGTCSVNRFEAPVSVVRMPWDADVTGPDDRMETHPRQTLVRVPPRRRFGPRAAMVAAVIRQMAGGVA